MALPPKPHPYPGFVAQDLQVAKLADEETHRARRLHNCSMEMASTERRLRILVEEVGETAAAIEEIDQAQRAGKSTSVARQHLLEEIIQVASGALRWAAAEMRDGGRRG
jgi:hypothetical protein